MSLWRVSHFSYYYAECHYAECHYAECHNAECHYAECHYAKRHYAECRGTKIAKLFFSSLTLRQDKLECFISWQAISIFNLA